jgi:hypothetical protein
MGRNMRKTWSLKMTSELVTSPPQVITNVCSRVLVTIQLIVNKTVHVTGNVHHMYHTVPGAGAEI